MGILKEAFASDPLPEAAAPKQHEGISTTLQHSLRTLGILSVVGGVIGGLFNAIEFANQTAAGFLVLGEAIGEGIVFCALFYALAAIVDALRIIAANVTPPAP
ncbi:hypothetical protein [Metallibacterium scheffleri]|uniref:Uncharacterized protein n=1 Tax=Metallibacterium scheffleri TaxID=993689 RepID=A0A4S3KLF0_9GAMM|nr:hypothetical protein [Metallibacterium scheffleri]THD09692.1 hypothetical protein B1806_10180 [Metallibacterium scheffleri]